MNLSIVCRTANTLAKCIPRSQAFKIAWSMLKGQAVEKVAGVTWGNRQAAIDHLTRYTQEEINFAFEREPGNHFDPNAVAVIATVKGNSYKMGYVPARTASMLAR